MEHLFVVIANEKHVRTTCSFASVTSPTSVVCVDLSWGSGQTFPEKDVVE